eukprot:Nitzschia sp. Nitz4//scaffold345_size17508//7524//7958//NITZ4_008823-RA/size17508-processed-gene-0.1-mRNA-1//1//CDS//3329548628//63//frame0
MVVLATGSSKSSSWGKRMAPFPPQSTIVLVGNLHTRQVADALNCQYTSKNPPVHVQKVCLMANSTNKQEERYAYCRFSYENEATLHQLTNHAMGYSQQRMKYLENVVGVPLSEVDAFVVGKIIGCKEAQNTSFYNDMFLELLVN